MREILLPRQSKVTLYPSLSRIWKRRKTACWTVWTIGGRQQLSNLLSSRLLRRLLYKQVVVSILALRNLSTEAESRRCLSFRIDPWKTHWSLAILQRTCTLKIVKFVIILLLLALQITVWLIGDSFLLSLPSNLARIWNPKTWRSTTKPIQTQTVPAQPINSGHFALKTQKALCSNPSKRWPLLIQLLVPGYPLDYTLTVSLNPSTSKR